MRLAGLARDRLEATLVVLLVASWALVVPRIAESDAIEYFSYLPSLVFDGDLDFLDEYTYFYEEDPEGRLGFKRTFLDIETATGRRLNFGPIGTALLWLPFYLLAHGLTVLAGWLGASVPADGLSMPYRWAVALGSAAYASAGLVLAGRLARRYASPEASFLAVATLWWASPVAYYMYVAPGMSHACSLFAVAVFLSLWPWAIEGGPRRWAAWGAAAGLMALVREQDGLVAVVAILAALGPAPEPWSPRDRLVRLAAFGAAAAAVFSPQLLVYQVLFGRPAPAPQVENKMDWSSPHFFEVLFSTEHGLFFWTPVLFLFAVGAVLLVRRSRWAGVLFLAAFLSQVYVSGAVESWTQAGAFGARRFVGTTAVLVVWGALVVDALRARLGRTAVALVLGLFCLWNVSLMIQFGLGLMDRQRLVWREVLHNHVYEVPPRLGRALARYLDARGARAEEGDETR